jgi:serine/threonine protein kinase
MCDYVAHKSIEIDNQQVLSLLGELKHDQEHISKVFDLLLNQLSPLLNQLMETRLTEGLELDQISNLMKRQCITSLSTQEQVVEVQSELLKLQPTLSFIRQRSDQILSMQENSSAEIKSAINQVRTLLDTMLSYSAPLSPHELNTTQRKNFHQLHSQFQAQFLAQDFEGMERTLESLRKLAPYHSMTNICEAAFSSIKQDFGHVQEVMSGLPDELVITGKLKEVKETFDRLSPLPPPDEDYSFEGEDGEVCFGHQGWRQVNEEESTSWSLENLSQGWLLHTRAGPKRAEQWTVMSLDGESGALHVIRGQLTQRGDYFRRFKDEVKSLKAVNHPSVLRVLDWGRTPSQDPYIVTEPLKGESLEERLTRGCLSPNEMKRLGSSLFESLEACHEQGVLHKNIHPCTIQFRADNTPVLTGYGVSCQELDHDDQGRRQDTFASPEQKRGEPLTAASDVYSLGSVLIDSVGGISSVPNAWRSMLNDFVDPVASSRPSASEGNDALATCTSKYYVTLPGRSSRGPYEVDHIVKLILQGYDEMTLQRVGSLYRLSWREIEEIATRVQQTQHNAQDVHVGDESSPNSPVPQQPSKAGQGDRDSTPELSTESVSNDVSASQDSQSVDGDPVVAVGQHLIKFSYQDGYQRSKYITVTDAVELAKQYSSSTKDHKFLSALREESNSNGDLAVSKSSADRFLKLLKGHLKKNNDPQSDRLSLMRAGGKGPFHLVMN